MKFFPTGRKKVLSFALRWIVVLLLFALGGGCMMQMPGHSHKGPLPPLSRDQAALRDRLRGHVTMLAGEIGERNVLHYRALQQAAQYVTSRRSEEHTSELQSR